MQKFLKKCKKYKNKHSGANYLSKKQNRVKAQKTKKYKNKKE